MESCRKDEVNTHYPLSWTEYNYKTPDRIHEKTIWRLRVNRCKWTEEDQNSKYHWIGSELIIFFPFSIPQPGFKTAPNSEADKRCKEKPSILVQGPGAGKWSLNAQK